MSTPPPVLLNQRVRVTLAMKNAPYRRADAAHIRCNGHGCGATIATASEEALERSLYTPIWVETHWKTYLCSACQRTAAYYSLFAAHRYCVCCLRFESATPLAAVPVTCGDARVEARLCGTCIAAHRGQLDELITVGELGLAVRRAIDTAVG